MHDEGILLSFLDTEKILRELEGCLDVIKSEEIEEHLNSRENKNLLIILDTNKRELVQSEEALNKIKKKLITPTNNGKAIHKYNLYIKKTAAAAKKA